MKKVLSILLLIGLSASVDAAGARRNPRRAATRAATVDAPVAPVANQGFCSKTSAFVKKHKVALGVGAVATVLTGLAIYNKKAVCQKTVDALAWMKRNKAASVAVITGLLALGAAGYVWHNADKDKTVIENIKGAGAQAWEDIKSAPKAVADMFNSGVNVAKEHPYYTAGGALGLVAVVAAAYDISRDNSVLKKAAKAIYNKLTNKEVGVTA